MTLLARNILKKIYKLMCITLLISVFKISNFLKICCIKIVIQLLKIDFFSELLYDDVFTVWETIWAAKEMSSSHFVLFIALALVETYRDIILANHMDFTDIIKFFNGKLKIYLFYLEYYLYIALLYAFILLLI